MYIVIINIIVVIIIVNYLVNFCLVKYGIVIYKNELWVDLDYFVIILVIFNLVLWIVIVFIEW